MTSSKKHKYDCKFYKAEKSKPSRAVNKSKPPVVEEEKKKEPKKPGSQAAVQSQS